MMFYVGQKVVCVDASGYEHALVEGKIYTVVRVGAECDIDDASQFIGIDHWLNNYPGGNGWLARRFRPLVEKKTDISVFREMLVPSAPRKLERVGEDA